MTQAKPRFSTFEDYLAVTDETPLEGFYELVEGELVELPPESEINDWLALSLRDYLIQLIDRRLVRVHTCEVQVPVLHPRDPHNRYPDLVVLREEHLALTQKRLTITRDMPPPQLVVEVVSPGQANHDRDYQRKHAQYCHIGIPEFWLVDPHDQVIIIWQLIADAYSQMGTFSGGDRVLSPTFPTFALTAAQVLKA